MESLAQLELFCERLYNSQDSVERTHAENTLKCFSSNIDFISQCRYILDNSLNPYALMLASSSLLKQVTEHSLPLQLHLDIRNYLVNYLENRGLELQPFVIGSLVQILCRLTKFGWFDDHRFRDVVEESINFLNQATSDHYAIGLKILNQLVCEINQTNPGLPSSRHRRVARSFNDQCLLQIFQISLTSLHHLKHDANDLLQELALSLSLKCLSFDFVGTSIDESSDIYGTVEMPSTWKHVIEDSSTLQIYFDYYALTKPPISKKSLECLVKLASARWSLFTNDVSRSKFLNHLMSGTKEILKIGQGLADHDNYHEFCRLLGRFGVIQVRRDGPSKSKENDDQQKVTARKRTQQPQSTESIIFTERARARRGRPSMGKENDDQQKSTARKRTQQPQSSLSLYFKERARARRGKPSKSKENDDQQKVTAKKRTHQPQSTESISFTERAELSELVTMEGYGDWIRLVAEFTLKSLLSWQWASSSVYYLLGLWNRLVLSVPYLKGDAPSFLDEFVPKIVEGFITSRLDSAQTVLAGNVSEDPLDNVDLLQDQLDRFPCLCRFQYKNSYLFIFKIVEPILQTYMEGAQLQSGDNTKLAVVEAKLAWIVHIIAPIFKIKQDICCRTHSYESQEVINADLAALVLRLVNVTDSGLHRQRYSELSKQRLDQAILTFFQCFGKSYMGEQAMLSSKHVYARLSELVGLNDHLSLLDFFVRKIATNLKCYTKSEEVIGQTLSLFLELASGYMTRKQLLKLDTVKFIVAHHTREHFPFLDEYRCSRSRTTFYYTIGQLIFLEDSTALFKSSMDPLLQVFITLESTPETMFRTDSVKYALIGLMRDLRGIAMATNSCRTYELLFDWIYPAHMPILLRGISCWADEPEVTTSLLKFMAIFVLKKTLHMTFDNSSPNSILLFREVSKLVVAYGTRILSVPSTSEIYGLKYKGICISLTILSRALAANYINFGVFELYGDRAFANALDISLKMILSVPVADILAYRKLTRAYFALVEVLFNSHLDFVLSLDTHTFMHIVGSLESGLKGLDAGIYSQCASAVDNLAAFYVSNITMVDTPTSPAAVNLARHIAEYPTLLPGILKTLFEVVLFEDWSNPLSVSRPMLGLILINEQMYTDLKAHILASQPVDQHQRLASCFDKLMAGVTRSLDSKNRDKFAQNLIVFRHDFCV